MEPPPMLRVPSSMVPLSDLYGASSFRVGEAHAFVRDLDELDREELGFERTVRALVERQAPTPIGLKFHRPGASSAAPGAVQTHGGRLQRGQGVIGGHGVHADGDGRHGVRRNADGVILEGEDVDEDDDDDMDEDDEEEDEEEEEEEDDEVATHDSGDDDDDLFAGDDDEEEEEEDGGAGMDVSMDMDTPPTTRRAW